MKKNTIRIVGFLFAAACVALLASCKNSTSPAKKDDGKKPTTTAAPAFDKAQLKGTWKYDTTSSDVYLFNFDDSATLRVAYGTALTQADIKTRAAEVKYAVSGGNANSGEITIDFGDVKIKSLFSLNDNVLTITNFNGSVVNLKKVTKEADVNVLKTVKFNEDKNKDTVVTNFNTNILRLGLTMPSSMAYKIVKLNNKEPGFKKDSTTERKVYHVAFGNTASDLVFAVELKTDKKKVSNKSYSTTLTHKDLGKIETKITANDLSLTDAVFTVTRDKDGIKTITIDKTILERDAGQYGTVTGSGYVETATLMATFVSDFDKNEQ